MMITTPREADSATKQERNTVDDIEKNHSKAKPSSSITSTPPWSRLRDPRIVRVSRAFGGKDRHSKVCTVKGLVRDRRVRLSVPTAIQLYDLQERLGLNQPSKVVDWLLNAAKHDIDELPPLQMPLGNFGQNDHDHDDQVSLTSTHGVVVDSSRFDTKGGVQMINSATVRWESSTFGNMDKSKEVIATAVDPPGKEEGENGEAGEDEEEAEVSANKFFPRSNYHSSIPGLLNNVVPYNSIYRWDPSIFSLSSHFTPQPDDDQDHPPNFNVVPLPSLTSLPPGSQVLVCPNGTTQPYFPSHDQATDSVDDFGPKQINHFEMLSSSSTSQQNPNFPSFMKAFQLSMTSPDLHQY